MGMQNQVEKLPGSKALASFCEKDDSAKEFSKEVRSILEVTAATGRYWHEWTQLRILLCFRLTQVLDEFHKLQNPDDAPPLVGPPAPGSESFADMKERLVQSLDSFTDGAPFTNQRLCEVLLCPKDTYNNLDKLALALEKLLLVQSTYPPSTDPYPFQSLTGAERAGEDQKADKLEGDTVNGAQDSSESFKEMPAIDEEMVDVERVLDVQVAVDMVASSNSDMLHEPSADEIPQAPGEDSKMLHISAGDDLPQVLGTNSEMAHYSSGVETTQAPSTTSEMLLETTGTDSVQAPATNTEMQYESAGADLPQVPATNFEMLHDSHVVELAQAATSASDMLHDSITSVELSNAAGSNTEMVHDSPGVELPPPSAPEGVGSSSEMLHDSTVVDLPCAHEESKDSIDAKPPRLEEGASNQIDSLGVQSPQASQGSVDMKQSGPEESVNSHLPTTDGEDRLEDVSMGMV